MLLGDYAEELTPFKLLNEPGAAISVLRRYDEKSYLKAISLLLTRCSVILNATNTLTDFQIGDLAVRIGKRYYFLKLEEILYVIQQATNGAYGKDFNRIDSIVVMGWLDAYDVNERTPLVSSVSSYKVDETPARMNDVELNQYYQRVADGHKTATESTTRLADLEKAKQDEARKRYVEEKAKGIVEDSQNLLFD